MITIQKATPEYLDQIAVLFDLYRSFYQQPADLPAAKTFLQERMANRESMIFMAADAKIAVGFTQLYPIFSSVGLQKAWLLNDLFVHPGARRKGIAAQLLEAARQHGLRTGARWLLLQTGNDNIAAQSAYEKNGWTRVSDYFYELPL